MFQRNILPVLQRRLGAMPVVLIVGPRQCGKTTLSKEVGRQKEMHYISCDHLTTLAAMEFNPEGFLRDQKKPLIIDEVQRAPEIVLPIKVDVDEHRYSGRYLLTGSANPLLMPQLGDSLVGRMGICHMWPLSQGELRGVRETFIPHLFEERFSHEVFSRLTQQEIISLLIKGGFPASVRAKDEEERREWAHDYLFNILQKDVNDLSKIEHFSQMPALLYAMASRIGSPLNLHSLTALVRTSETTIRRYLELLKSLFLLYPIPAWSRNIDKKLSKGQKIYFSDATLLLQTMEFDASRLQRFPQVLGQVFENFVIMELVKQATWSSPSISLYHYRTQDQKEVDSVLESTSGKIVGIEIKLSDTVRKEDLQGLLSLKQTAGDDFHRGIVLYTGEQVISFGEDIQAVPLTALWT